MIELLDIHRKQYNINSALELMTRMADRDDDGFNCFVLSLSGQTYPYLQILCFDDLATLFFADRDDSAGFASVGNDLRLPEQGSTLFRLDEKHKIPHSASNAVVVAFSSAVDAAKEFLEKKALPTCISWYTL